jgi:hypothetical protein
MACSGFYEVNLLRDLAGSLLLWAYTKEPASALVVLPFFPHVQCQYCLYFLLLLFIENTPNSFLISPFLILYRLVHPFTDLRN